MCERYKIPFMDSINSSNYYRTELIIRQSRFITSTAHAPTPEDAKDFIQLIKQEFVAATHNCWAYIANEPRQTTHIGFSDDGEPHGTAGRPMLTVLSHSNIGEIVCVVTRFFGGIKLGTGGLVKAYQASVKENLISLPLTTYVTLSTLEVSIAYPYIDKIRHLLPQFEVKTTKEVFEHMAIFEFTLPLEHLQSFTDCIIAQTKGSAIIKKFP